MIKVAYPPFPPANRHPLRSLRVLRSNAVIEEFAGARSVGKNRLVARGVGEELEGSGEAVVGCPIPVPRHSRTMTLELGDPTNRVKKAIGRPCLYTPRVGTL